MGSTHEGHLRGVPMVIYGEYPWGSSMGSTHGSCFMGSAHGGHFWGLPIEVVYGEYPWDCIPRGNITEVCLFCFFPGVNYCIRQAIRTEERPQ